MSVGDRLEWVRQPVTACHQGETEHSNWQLSLWVGQAQVVLVTGMWAGPNCWAFDRVCIRAASEGEMLDAAEAYLRRVGVLKLEDDVQGGV